MKIQLKNLAYKKTHLMLNPQRFLLQMILIQNLQRLLLKKMKSKFLKKFKMLLILLLRKKFLLNKLQVLDLLQQQLEAL